MGVDHSGGPFHSHTDALLGLLVGKKHWLISRDSSHRALTQEEEISHMRARQVAQTLQARGALDEIGGEYWQCTQQPGDMLWVPGGLAHTVVNIGETIGISMQSTTMPYDLLVRAASNGHTGAIQWLTSASGGSLDPNAIIYEELTFEGTSTRIERGEGETALHAAARAGHARSIQALIDCGARIDIQGRHGLEAVHVAAGQGQVASLRALLAAGANVDAMDARGDTPLTLAAVSSKGNLNVISALIEAMPSTASLMATYEKANSLVRSQLVALDSLRGSTLMASINLIQGELERRRVHEGNT